MWSRDSIIALRSVGVKSLLVNQVRQTIDSLGLRRSRRGRRVGRHVHLRRDRFTETETVPTGKFHSCIPVIIGRRLPAVNTGQLYHGCRDVRVTV